MPHSVIMPSSPDRPRRANTEPPNPITRRAQVPRHAARKPSSLPGHRVGQAIGGHTAGQRPPWSTASAEFSCGDTETGSDAPITGADIPLTFGLRRWLEESDPVQRLLDAHRQTSGGHGSPEFRPPGTWSSAVKGSLPIPFGKGIRNSACGGQDADMVLIGSFGDDIDR